MGLTAIVTDPLLDPPPAGWDTFITAQELMPLWRADLLRTAAQCSQVPSTMVMVSDSGSGAPVAIFHTRHLGLLTNPTRFTRPGRVPRLALTECRATPVAMGAGLAFAADVDPATRAEAVRVFEREVRRHAGIGGLALAYRELTPELLPLVPTDRRIRLRLGPTMVLDNQWSDLDSYLASLSSKWRSQLKKIRQTVAADPDLRIELVDTIGAEEAGWLAELVRRRHTRQTLPRPPLPDGYFARFAALPGTQFLTYRDTSGRLLGFSAVLRYADELVLVWWGSRDDIDGARPDLYFDQYLRLVELMISSGAQRLVMGKGMEQIKGRYGAQPHPLWAVVGWR
jgi:hypothetical protein